MPRTRRHDRISGYHLEHIERQAIVLGTRIVEAQVSLTPFRPHYDALSELQSQIRRTLNLLRDLPADFQTQRTSGAP